jgi:hypothetical protein
LADIFLKQYRDSPASILCLDHFFTSPPRIQVADSREASASLQLFQEYIRLLRHVAMDQAENMDSNVQKLFAIQLTDQLFLLPLGTHLHRYVLDKRIVVARSTEQGLFVAPREAAFAIRQALLQRLRHRISLEDTVCLRARAFNPVCLQFSVYNQCNRPECARHHLNAAALTVEWYTTHIRVHLQQFVILQVLLTLA